MKESHWRPGSPGTVMVNVYVSMCDFPLLNVDHVSYKSTSTKQNITQQDQLSPFGIIH